MDLVSPLIMSLGTGSLINNLMRINYSEFCLECPFCTKQFKIRVEMTDNTELNKKIIKEACYQLGKSTSRCNHKKNGKSKITKLS